MSIQNGENTVHCWGSPHSYGWFGTLPTATLVDTTKYGVPSSETVVDVCANQQIFLTASGKILHDGRAKEYTDFTHMECDYDIVLGIRQDGSVWGQSSLSEYEGGNAFVGRSMSRMKLPEGSKALFLTSSGHQSCAYLSSGEVWCSGRNVEGKNASVHEFAVKIRRYALF